MVLRLCCKCAGVSGRKAGLAAEAILRAGASSCGIWGVYGWFCGAFTGTYALNAARAILAELVLPGLPIHRNVAKKQPKTGRKAVFCHEKGIAGGRRACLSIGPKGIEPRPL